jgi:hypothetical protein
MPEKIIQKQYFLFVLFVLLGSIFCVNFTSAADESEWVLADEPIMDMGSFDDLELPSIPEKESGAAKESVGTTQPDPANQNQNKVNQNSAVVIEPGKNGEGYSWSGSTLTIIGGNAEYMLSNAISKSTAVHVDADEITLDGNGVPISGIRGNPTLDLVNVHVDGGIREDTSFENWYYLIGITECRNIKDSVIGVIGVERIEEGTRFFFSGIGKLYGNLDDTTTITVTSQESSVTGVDAVYGTISGGTFTVTSKQNHALGVGTVYGTISGGKFTITSQQDTACGVHSVPEDGSGMISGGEFILNGKETAPTSLGYYT